LLFSGATEDEILEELERDFNGTVISGQDLGVY
jgi:hypothetical protein